MKFLIKNRKEFAISIGFFVMTAINLVKAIMSKDLSEDLIIAVVYGFFGVLAWFYNMPTSEENCIHTGMMRFEKEEKNGKVYGEHFLMEDEPYDDEEVEENESESL